MYDGPQQAQRQFICAVTDYAKTITCDKSQESVLDVRFVVIFTRVLLFTYLRCPPVCICVSKARTGLGHQGLAVTSRLRRSLGASGEVRTNPFRENLARGLRAPYPSLARQGLRGPYRRPDLPSCRRDPGASRCRADPSRRVVSFLPHSIGVRYPKSDSESGVRMAFSCCRRPRSLVWEKATMQNW